MISREEGDVLGSKPLSLTRGIGRSLRGKRLVLLCVFLFSVIANFASAAPMPLPSGNEAYQYLAGPDYRKSSDPSIANPLGIGRLGMGGDTLDLQVGFADFSAPVDIYIGITAPSLGPDLLMITKDNGLQPASQGLAKWREGVTASIDQKILTGIPVSGLPDDTYNLYVLVAPAGNLGSFYLWNTSFTLPQSQSELGDIGQLPDKFAMPAGSVDQAAEALAKEVLAGGSRTLPALITAVQAAGIAIRNGNDIVVTASEPSQGFAVNAYELQMIAALINSGETDNLSGVADDFLSVAPDLMDKQTMVNILIDGITDAAKNGTGPRRFWGRFIVELGRQSSAPYDMLAASMTDIPINPAQLNFILWRLAADLFVLQDASTQQPGVSARVKTPARMLEGGGGDSPCTSSGLESFIQDQTAAAMKLGFSKLYGYTDKILNFMDPAKTFKTGATVANALLTYAKLIATKLMFHATIRMEDPGPPLPRTRMTNQDGEQRNLILEAKMDEGDMKWLNCLRGALNLDGLDFNLPPDGAYKGADVQWSIEKGGSIVEFYGKNPVKDNVTDDKGMTSIGIEGMRQKRDLPKDAKQVNKTAIVNAEIALKRNDFWKDVSDPIWSVAGGMTGLGKILITLPAKLMERTHWGGARYTFTVKDWSDEIAYKGTVKALQMDNYNRKLFESTADVTYQQAYDQDGEPIDGRYFVCTGTVSLTIYPWLSTGCTSTPASFKKTYEIQYVEGTLTFQTDSTPAFYKGDGKTIISLINGGKPATFNVCCPSSEGQRCDKQNANSDYFWWYTGSNLFAVQPDGSLKDKISVDHNFYEWNFVPVDDSN